MKISDSDYLEKKNTILDLMKKDTKYWKVHSLMEALTIKYQIEPMDNKRVQRKYFNRYLMRMIEENLLNFSEAGGVLLAWPTDNKLWPHGIE